MNATWPLAGRSHSALRDGARRPRQPSSRACELFPDVWNGSNRCRSVEISNWRMQNGALRRRTGAELSRRGEDELARSKRIRRQGTLTARLSALRTPLPENSNDFGLLCAQVYAEMGHRGSFVDQDQCRASSPPARAPQRRSASFGGQCAHA